MSLRSTLAFVVAVAVAAGVGCGGARPGDEPQTAREKQRREARADKDDDDTTAPKPSGKKWGGWRYKGDRDKCFFSFNGRCFKTEDAACGAAKCGAKKCKATGGGPAIVECKK